MNLHDIEAALDKMTDEQKQTLLNAEVDAELEKEAAAEVAQSDFESALYAYGMYKADLEVETEGADEAGLSKEASEQFEAAEAEISQAIEAGVEELGLNDIEEDAEFHKTAMAMATVIFEGYCDQMEKIAAGKGGFAAKAKGFMKSVGKKVGKHVDAAKAQAGKAGKAVKKHVGKHSEKYIGAGAALAGYGAGRAQEHMKKSASELTTEELVDLTLSKQATLDVIADGIEKLAARGGGKAEALKKAMKSAGKHFGAHKKKYLAGAGGGAAGYLAGRMHGKHKKD